MNAGFVVMGRMIAIVEHHEIGKPAGKITGMVIM